MAGRGHRDRGIRLWRLRRDLELHVRLHRRRLLRKVQRWREGCGGKAGGGQPARELRRRGVQAGGVLHRGPRGWVVLLLALLLSGELGSLRGRRHSSLSRGHELLKRNPCVRPRMLENWPLVAHFKPRPLRRLCWGPRLLPLKGVRLCHTRGPRHKGPRQSLLLKRLLLG